MNKIEKKAIDRAIDAWVSAPKGTEAPFAHLLTDEPAAYTPRRLEAAFPAARPMGGREKFAWFVALVATMDLAILGVAWAVMS